MNGTKDFALEQELSIEAENQKGDVMFCCSSMSVASGEGSHWETAVAILMLRHCIEAVNAELLGNQKHVGLGKGGKRNDRTQHK